MQGLDLHIFDKYLFASRWGMSHFEAINYLLSEAIFRRKELDLRCWKDLT